MITEIESFLAASNLGREEDPPLFLLTTREMLRERINSISASTLKGPLTIRFSAGGNASVSKAGSTVRIRKNES